MAFKIYLDQVGENGKLTVNHPNLRIWIPTR